MIHYVEFDTTSQALLQDLDTQILLCTDWARIGSDGSVVGVSTSASSENSAAYIDVASTAGMGIVVGQSVTYDVGVKQETRLVDEVLPSQIKLNGSFAFAHSAGAEIRLNRYVYKATTTRGAQMAIDLAGRGLNPFGSGMSIAVYQSHDGAVSAGKLMKYLQWRHADAFVTQPLHVTLSLSKEHFFLAVEGPRAGEAGASSTQYGSHRNYFFLNDLVPYDEEDVTPVVVCGGANMVSTNASVAFGSHVAHVSRNLEDTAFWAPARLASLQFPSAGETSVLNVQRQREIDDRYILAPYVVFADDTGMRGRLHSIFLAGFNQASEYAVSPPSMGARVQYQGLWYKLIAPNKGDGARAAWGPLGAASNELVNTYQRSIVVGVPCLP